jgi:hypothetical protein
MSYMFRPPKGHLQDDIQRILESARIIYGREVPLIQIMPQVLLSLNQFLKYNLLTHRPVKSWVHYTTSCNTQSSVPEDG